MKQYAIALTLALALTHCTKNKQVDPSLNTELSAEEKKATEQKLDDAMKLAFDTVYFEFDSSDITEAAQANLKNMADALKKLSQAKIQIEGNSDDRGSNEYNIALGERRANAIKDFLLKQGVQAEKLVTVSRGEENPAVEGTDESAWSKNRRGDFVRLN